MKRIIIQCSIVIGSILALILIWNLTAYRDIDHLREVEVAYLSNMQLEIINYDGYQGSVVHGGYTWYTTKDTSGYIYKLALGEWDGITMLYSMKCLNAVSNKK